MTPNIDSDLIVGFEMHTLELVGPGGTSGAFAIDGKTGSNDLDWAEFSNLHIRDCAGLRTAEYGTDRPIIIREIQTVFCAGTSEFGNNTRVVDSTLNISSGGQVDLKGGWLVNTNVHGVGESKPLVLVRSNSRWHSGKIRKTGGSAGSGTGIQVTNNGAVGDVTLVESGGSGSYLFGIDLQSGTGQIVDGFIDNSNSSNSINLSGNTTEPRITRSCVLSNGLNVVGPTRAIVSGKSWTSSASPGSGSSQWDGSETIAHELNVTVEDRSVASPYPAYICDSAGNWTQIS